MLVPRELFPLVEGDLESGFSQLFRGDARDVMAAFYGVVAMLSFSGMQNWVNYNGDSSLLGPLMSIWDLTLAVALVTD